MRQRCWLVERQADRIVRPRAFANRKSQQNEHADRSELRPSCCIDQRRAALQTDDVDVCEQNDGAGRDQIAASERPAENGHNRFVRRCEWQNRAKVFGKPNRERSDGSALADGKNHPAVEERRKFAIGFAQVNVLSARFWIHRRHLGEGEASQQRDESADKPDAQKVKRLVHCRCDLPSGKKDARADDSADHQHDGIHQREAAN